jgi:hypothetical protein
VDELLASFSSGQMIAIEDSDRLPCFAAVLEEGLRLYSPVVPEFHDKCQEAEPTVLVLRDFRPVSTNQTDRIVLLTRMT